MNINAASTTRSKILEAKMIVNRIRPHPDILPTSAHEVLTNGELPLYNFTRIELTAHTIVSGTRSISINNAVLGRMTKSLAFTMIKIPSFSDHTIPISLISVIITELTIG
jgi:hypothetical protein